MELTLTGCGVDPNVQVIPEEGPIDWGYVMTGDIVIQTVHIENLSEVPVDFHMKTEKDYQSGIL